MIAACVCPAWEGAAWGQVRTFELDASGNWVQTAEAEPGSDEGIIDEARRLLATDQPSAARGVLDPWITANARSNSPWLAEAYVLRGDALTAEGYEYDALYDYELVITQFAASDQYVVAVQRELEIGIRYVNGLDRRFLGLRWLDATDAGEELLIRVQERMPGSRLAERAGIELADYFYRERDLTLAADAYDLFLRNYPNSAYRSKAMQRRVYATIGQYKGPRYDGAALVDAEVLTRRYADLYPTQARATGLDESLVTRLDESAGRHMLETARWYLAREDEPSARYTLKRLLKQHARTAAGAEALELMRARGWMAAKAKAEAGVGPGAVGAAATMDGGGER